MSDNYPPGTAHDPKAPWNQKDSEMTEWEQSGTTKDVCVCCGEIEFTDEDSTCEECFIPEEIDHEGEDDSRWEDDIPL